MCPPLCVTAHFLSWREVTTLVHKMLTVLILKVQKRAGEATAMQSDTSYCKITRLHSWLRVIWGSRTVSVWM